MNYNNLFKIQYSKAIEYLEKAKEFVDIDNRTVISAIIKTHQEKINGIQNQTLCVINPTKTEIGTVNSVLKKIVKAFYLTPLEKVMKGKITAINPDLVNEELSDDEYEKMLDEWWRQKELYVHSPYAKLNDKINKACNETKIPEYIVCAKILLLRKTNNNYFNRSEIDDEINEHLNILMLQEFNEQNKELITNLTKQKHETSK